MSDSCCEIKPAETAAQKRALVIVLFINLTFFFVEGVAGWIAQSSALLADAVDMGGDALVYFFSLLALGSSLRTRSKVALFNSSFEMLLGAAVLIEAISKLFRDVTPISHAMFLIGGAALLGNLLSGALLLRHRDKDINMKAVWVCTRNDVINNLLTLLAAALVSFTGSKWPDIAAGFLISGLIVWFSLGVLKEALKTL